MNIYEYLHNSYGQQYATNVPPQDPEIPKDPMLRPGTAWQTGDRGDRGDRNARFGRREGADGNRGGNPWSDW